MTSAYEQFAAENGIPQIGSGMAAQDGVTAPKPEDIQAVPDTNSPFVRWSIENGIPRIGAPKTSIFSTVLHEAERAVAPTTAGLIAAGGAAEIGAAMGSIVGPIGTGVGGFVGALTGFFTGEEAVRYTQDWIIHRMPESWQRLIGQDIQTQQAETAAHSNWQFAAGFIPQVLTMSPRVGVTALREGASAFERIMANRVTARLFSSTMMAGIEAGQEKFQGEPLDPWKVGLATAFGLFFPHTNALGRKLSGLLVPSRAGRPPEITTVSRETGDATDLKVAGPSVTEPVFLRHEEMNPKAEAAAREATSRAIELEKGPAIAGGAVPAPDRAAELRTISHDQATQLLKAGRPTEEAIAAGDLVAAHYEARSERFRGAIGTPAEIYNREGAIVRSQGGGGTPSAAIPPPPAPLPTPPPPAPAAPFQPSQAQLDAYHEWLRSKEPAKAANIAKRLGGDQAQGERMLQYGIKQGQIIVNRTGKAVRRAVIKGPLSAMEFIAQHGGISDRGGELAARNFDHRSTMTRLGPAVRKKGRAPEEMMKLLVQEGFIHDPGRLSGGTSEVTTQDVFNLLDKEKAGQKQVSARDQAEQDKLDAIAVSEAGLDELTTRYEPHEQAFIQEHGFALYDAFHTAGIDVRDVKPEDARLASQLIKEGAQPEDAIVNAAIANYDADLAEQSPEFQDTISEAELEEIPLPDGIDDYLSAALPEAQAASGQGAEPGSAGLLPAEQRANGDAIETPGEEAAREYSQRDQFGNTIEPGAEGKAQAVIPGAERITDAELAQRKANEALKPKVAQKPTEFGLFGDESKQTSLFQGARGKIRFTEGARPIITLMKDANASTFIHETGHQWLEELARDALHPMAPSDIKADLATVRSWLGAKEGEAFTVRQHEKFARGFEQYLREGRAPSSRLAGVFAKFRDWLVSIYQTIARLGTPINDDIRAVFDRMIAAQPEPQPVGGPTLQDIHADDAAHTPPAEAWPAMDRIISEAARFEADLSPEVQNELATVTGRDASPGAGATGQMGEGGSGPEAQPPRGPSSGPVGNVVPSGSDTGAKSAGVGEVPVTPSAPFAPSSDLVDKAGNIRLDTLTTNEDVKAAIRDSAAINDDFIAYRRNVVTDGMVLDLAEALGMTAERLSTRKIGEAFNAEQVMAARKLLIQSATTVSQAMKRAASGSDDDVLAYALARDRHKLIQGQVAGITAEAGRALRAFHNITGQEGLKDVNQFIRNTTGRTLFQMRQEAKLGAQLATPQKVSQLLNDSRKRSFGRWILEYWINNLISGPTTHVTYMIGNTILAVEKLGPETALAALIGAARRASGRQGETVRLGEIGAQLRGAARGFLPAINASIESLRTGTTATLPGEEPYQATIYDSPQPVISLNLNEHAGIRDIGASMFGLMRGVRDGFIAGAAEQDAALVGLQFSPLGNIADVTIKGYNVLPLGTVQRLPSRFISSIHSFFRTMNYSIEKGSLAYRTAANEGLSGDAFAKRVGELHANPPTEMMARAASEATDLALMGQAGLLTKRLSHLLNAEIPAFGQDLKGPLGYAARGLSFVVSETPWARFIDPFVTIGSNIIREAVLKRSPLGLLAPTIVRELAGEMGTAAADRAAARMLAGTGLILLYGWLKAEGYISGSGPEDASEAAMWRVAGNQAHSVRVGDFWYQVNRLGPMGMHLSIAADMFDVAQYIQKDEYDKAGAAFQMAITNTVMDEGWMRGPADLIKAIENQDNFRESYIRNQLATFVPFSVGAAQIARAIDPYSRIARTITDAARRKVPYLSEDLWAERDVWGEKVPSRDAAIAAGVTAIYAQKINNDPVNITMLNLGIHPGRVGRRILNIELTPQQYDDYARLAGRIAKMQLDRIVVDPEFVRQSSYDKADFVRKVIEDSRETARGMVISKYPQIRRDAQAFQQERLAP